MWSWHGVRLARGRSRNRHSRHSGGLHQLSSREIAIDVDNLLLKGGPLGAHASPWTRSPQTLWLWEERVASCFGFRIGAIQQCLHIGGATGRLRVASALKRGRVIQNNDALEIHAAQRLHDLVHVVIAVSIKVSTKCGNGALTLRKWIFQIFCEVANHFLGVFAGEPAAASSYVPQHSKMPTLGLFAISMARR
jgi:hypothetical protein